MSNDTNAVNRERTLEEESLSLGKERYRKMLTIKGHADTPTGQRLMRLAIDPLTKAITDFVGAHKRGRRANTAVLMEGIDPAAMALLTCRVVFQGISDRKTSTAVARVIGLMLSEHLDWIKLRAKEKPLTKKVERQLQKKSSDQHRRAVARHVVSQYMVVDRVDWTEKDIVSIGMTLLELMSQHTGMIEIKGIRKGHNRFTNYVYATDMCLKFLEEGHARAELLNPVFMPMVCKPKPWTSPSSGGYLQRNAWLVKTTNRSYLDELHMLDMPEVYTAVNALQDTAYRINPGILATLKQAWESNDQVGGLPNREKDELPAKPHDIADNEEARVAWRRAAAKVHEANAQRVSAIISTDRKLMLAEKFSAEESIYFPHTLDWRGRAYPLPVDLQPQGDDAAKALLHYAEAKPITAEGALWLKIHIANLFGVDKVSHVERIKWTEDHEAQLLEAALTPLDNQFWQDADKPWQALAACFEYAGYIMEGDGYMSRLPIAMDGSCNGLQNLSAMLLDPAGGKATNLVPSDKPQDIYTLVATRVMDKLADISKRQHTGNHNSDEDLEAVKKADMWLNMGVSRKLVKRPVMTKPYGVTAFGMRDQLIQEVRKQGLFEEDQNYPMATFIAPLVNEAIGEIVVASKEVMDWLQDTAGVAAAAELPLRWTTPCGLPVLQDYRKMKGKKVEIIVGGLRRQLRLSMETDNINRKKQALGMSPNVIHSLDASHMMRTICLAKADGIEDFTMVHDSYATHACNIGDLNSILRFAFVDIYKDNVLQDLSDQFVSQVAPEVASEFPAVPAQGDLDLDAVQDSLYFFA